VVADRIENAHRAKTDARILQPLRRPGMHREDDRPFACNLAQRISDGG
jgi:hypothetical protein